MKLSFAHLGPFARIVSLRRKQVILRVFKKHFYGSENIFDMQTIIHVQVDLFVNTFNRIYHLCAKCLPLFSPIIKHGFKKEGEMCGQREGSSLTQ